LRAATSGWTNKPPGSFGKRRHHHINGKPNTPGDPSMIATSHKRKKKGGGHANVFYHSGLPVETGASTNAANAGSPRCEG